MIQTAYENQVEVVDGLLIDTETGEIVGVVAADGGHVRDGEPLPVLNESEANGVLARILNRDAAIAAATHTLNDVEEEIRLMTAKALADLEDTEPMIRARAIQGNCNRIIERKQKEKESLLNRYREGLKAFAQAMLKGKVRTLELAYGRISLRKTGGRLKVADANAFVEYALEFEPSWLKMEPRISAVPGDVDGDVCARAGLERTPEEDEVSVATGARS